MASTPEGKVKAEVKAALRAEGLVPFTDFLSGAAKGPVTGFYYMPVAGRFSVLGVHDFVGCWGGVFFSIETKAPDAAEDATYHQERFRHAVTQSGGIALTGVRSGEAVAQLKALVRLRLRELTFEFPDV